MTEILIDVDFGHPPERVWLALTDRTVLSRWFMRTDLEPRVGHRFRLVPDGLLGLAGPLEGELVEVARLRRLVMLLRGEQLHSRVTWELVPLPDGCRLRLSHTGFIGVRGSLRRQELKRTYDRMLNHRLPQALDEIAAGKVPPPGAPAQLLSDGPAAADRLPPPPVPVPPGGAADGARGAGRRNDQPTPAGRWFAAAPAWAAPLLRHGARLLPRHVGGPALRPTIGYPVLAAVAGLLTVLAIVGAGHLGGWFSVPPADTGPGDPYAIPSVPRTAMVPPVGQTPAGDPAGVEGSPNPVPASPGPAHPAAGTPGVPQPGVVPPPDAPPPGAGPSAAPPPPAWTASYQTLRSSADGFTGQVTVTNNGTAAATGWRVTITLPPGATLQAVRSARGAQSGTTVTITPINANQRVEPGTSRLVKFEVTGGDATAPTGCRIEGENCAGIPE